MWQGNGCIMYEIIREFLGNNFVSGLRTRATGNSRFENAKFPSPRQSKNSRKFPFGNMLDFARCNSNTYKHSF